METAVKTDVLQASAINGCELAVSARRGSENAVTVRSEPLTATASFESGVVALLGRYTCCQKYVADATALTRVAQMPQRNLSATSLTTSPMVRGGTRPTLLP